MIQTAYRHTGKFVRSMQINPEGAESRYKYTQTKQMHVASECLLVLVSGHAVRAFWKSDVQV